MLTAPSDAPPGACRTAALASAATSSLTDQAQSKGTFCGHVRVGVTFAVTRVNRTSRCSLCSSLVCSC